MGEGISMVDSPSIGILNAFFANRSIYDIAQALEADGEALSPAMVAIIL